MLIDADAAGRTSNIGNGFFKSVSADSCGDNGYDLRSISHPIGNLMFVECWGAGCLNCGFRVNMPTADSIHITGGAFTGNGKYLTQTGSGVGIQLDAGTRIFVGGGVICRGNRTAGVGVGAGMQDYVIDGVLTGMMTHDQFNQEYGIYVEPSVNPSTGRAGDHYVITNNYLRTNGLHGLSPSLPGTDTIVSNNLGA